MKRKKYFAFALSLVLAAVLCCGCASRAETESVDTAHYSGERWYLGFGRQQIIPPEDDAGPLYIAGYNSGKEIDGVLDYCEARAVWIDTGAEGFLLIGVDCVGLDSGSVAKIRSALADLPDCAAIHVYSTHTHAGIDTLGLWGPVGINGKNEAYMERVISAAAEAGRQAAAGRTAGELYYGFVATENMYRDSRQPWVYDENLYHLRFAPEDGSAGIRLYFYGAHAESLRDANTLLSRDFPGALCDEMQARTGDSTMFFPGAIGGLIMTREFVSRAKYNLERTADRLVAFAEEITPAQERRLAPELAFSRVHFTIPMDNGVFLLYKYLGILTNRVTAADSATGYGARTELSVMLLDDIGLTLLPGEIFPELAYGGEYGDANPDGINPAPLTEIARANGVEQLLIVGLANDEIGYIVPPSDFLVHEEMPYLERITDYKGEDHYEETNSLGPLCAPKIAAAFQAALEALN